jgi:hypothetical protein
MASYQMSPLSLQMSTNLAQRLHSLLANHSRSTQILCSSSLRLACSSCSHNDGDGNQHHLNLASSEGAGSAASLPGLRGVPEKLFFPFLRAAAGGAKGRRKSRGHPCNPGKGLAALCNPAWESDSVTSTSVLKIQDDSCFRPWHCLLWSRRRQTTRQASRHLIVRSSQYQVQCMLFE